MNKFKIGDLVKLRNPDNYKHFGEEIVKQLDGEILVVTYLSVGAQHSVLCSTRDDKKEWFFQVDDLEPVVESVQENPSQILKEDEIHWWVVLDKNGNRTSSLSHSIASAAATTSRGVEDLLMDGYSFQKVAIAITPVFTLRGEYEQV